jgi:hypothetical protein
VHLTKSVCFAIEMVKACLPRTPTGLDMSGWWTQMDMETSGTKHRKVLLLIYIYGLPSHVSASCEVFRENGEWARGTCTINLSSDPKTTWTFNCLMAQGQIQVSRDGILLPA